MMNAKRRNLYSAAERTIIFRPGPGMRCLLGLAILLCVSQCVDRDYMFDSLESQTHDYISIAEEDECSLRIEALQNLLELRPMSSTLLRQAATDTQSKNNLRATILHNLAVLDVLGDRAKEYAELILGQPQEFAELAEELETDASTNGINIEFPVSESTSVLHAEPAQVPLLSHRVKGGLAGTASFLLSYVAVGLLTPFFTGDWSDPQSAIPCTLIGGTCAGLAIRMARVSHTCSLRSANELRNTLEAFSLDSLPLNSPIMLDSQHISKLDDLEYKGPEVIAEPVYPGTVHANAQAYVEEEYPRV